jgi:ERO1-like protein beta
MNRECGITTVDEVWALVQSIIRCNNVSSAQSQIPEKWRAATLSKIELPPIEKVQLHSKHSIFIRTDEYNKRIQLPGCYYRESDFCYLDDLTGEQPSYPISHHG